MSAKTRCRNCGREFSKADSHRLCKRCRPSNAAYEETAQRRFRKSIRAHARYWHRAPNFTNFDVRLKSWTAMQQEIKKYKAVLARIAAIL